MKTLQLVPLVLLAFILNVYTCNAQENNEEEAVEEIEIEEVDEPMMMTATFMGMDDTLFIFTYMDYDGEESEMVFDKLAPEAKKAFNLTDKSMIGKKFKVTYITENVEDDDDEEMLVSVRTITALEKL